MDDRKPVILEPGRWTVQRKDETPSEAMNRLMRGDEGDKSDIPKPLRDLMDKANQASPHFKSK